MADSTPTAAPSATSHASVAPLPWTKVLGPRRGLLDIPWRELWRYRDLIFLLALRDISATYKQTVLGPFWFVIQPMLTSATFSFIFGRMAKLGTDHIPHFLFYMSGLLAWGYFADCVNKTAQTFNRNAHIFGKVYFPRLAVPISAVLTNLLTLFIQLGIFLLALGFYMAKARFFPDPAHPFLVVTNWRVVLLPLLVVQIAALGLGIGLIISSLSTRYRDLTLATGFGLQLWMYASSIVFPLSKVDTGYRSLLVLNPMVPIVESFRFAFLGAGVVEKWHLALSGGISCAVLLIGVMMFNRVEQTVMDTV